MTTMTNTRLITTIRSLFLICFFSLFISGCAPSGTVRLIYSAAETNVLPAPNAPRIVVVLFEDKRPEQPVGQKKDGTLFMPSSSVAEWITRSIADELSRMGPQVSYAFNLEQARAAKPDFIVTGVVSEVWAKELNTAMYSATIRISFSLANQTTVKYSENLGTTQESAGIPKADMVENLLFSVLRNVAGVAASKINEATRR